MEKWKVFCALDIPIPRFKKKLVYFTFGCAQSFFFAACWLSLVVWSRSYSPVLGSRGYSL